MYKCTPLFTQMFKINPSSSSVKSAKKKFNTNKLEDRDLCNSIIILKGI